MAPMGTLLNPLGGREAGVPLLSGLDAVWRAGVALPRQRVTLTTVGSLEPGPVHARQYRLSLNSAAINLPSQNRVRQENTNIRLMPLGGAV